MPKNNFLFSVEGVVQEGSKKGKELGFPTANLRPEKLYPSGIFAGEATWKGTVYLAAIYNDGERDVVEAHLIDFSGNLYGERLLVVAYEKVRDAKKFGNVNDLVAAIADDIKKIKSWFLSRDLHAARGNRT